MDVLDRKDEVIGVITASLWAIVGDDNHTLGRIDSMEIKAEILLGQTVPVIVVQGSRGVAMFNWDHVEAVVFAPHVEMDGAVEPEEDEVPF